MPRPYSADLRARALRAGDRAKASRAEVARRFEVAEATLYGGLKQEREEGRREAKPHAASPPTIDAAGLAVVRGLVAADNAATLEEYVERYAARTKQRVSVALMCRTLRRLDLPRYAPESTRLSPAGRRSRRGCGPRRRAPSRRWTRRSARRSTPSRLATPAASSAVVATPSL